MRATLVASLLLGACARPAAPAPAGPAIESMAELALLMKDDINPPFSRLSFLVFHGDEVEADADALRAELETNAALLGQALARLRALPSVPTRTEEGRAVFFTYADSVERATAQLGRAVAAGEQAQAAAQLERIADTCNSCHHFFRLQIEDAVVPRAAALDPVAAVATAARPVQPR